MGQHLLLQHLLGILDPPLLGDAGLGTSGADEVESHILLLDHEGLIQRGFYLTDRVIRIDVRHTQTCQGIGAL